MRTFLEASCSGSSLTPVLKEDWELSWFSAGQAVIPSNINLLVRKEGNVDIRRETSSVLHALLRAVLNIENIMVLIIHQILKNCYLNIGKKYN